MGAPDINLDQAPVVQMFDSAIHRINCYPVDKYLGNQLRYPLDRDLSTSSVQSRPRFCVTYAEYSILTQNEMIVGSY